jgi:predicted TIM-barrel fold metal-dependent hydrolase
MTVKLIDIQNSILGYALNSTEMVSGAELIAEMDKCRVAQAVCSLMPDDLECDLDISNRKLYEACVASEGRILPCPIVAPDEFEPEYSAEKQVGRALDHGAPMVRIRPVVDSWEILPWVSGKLFSVLQSHRLPLLLEQTVGFKLIGEMAAEYPGLPLIIYNVSYRSSRILPQLLDAFDNVYLSAGNNFTFHCGIEKLIELGGEERLLFGTGFPRSEMMSAITQLMYSDISGEQKNLIGSGNFERLLKSII